MINHRRDFLAKGFLLAGAAGVAASGLRPGAAVAQTAPRPIRRSERYDDSVTRIDRESPAPKADRRKRSHNPR